LLNLQLFLYKPEHASIIKDESIRFPKTDGKLNNIKCPAAEGRKKHMELWLAALLLVIVTVGAVTLLFYSRKKQNRRWLIAGICVLGMVLLILVVYITLTFLFLDAISSEAPPDRLESVEPSTIPDEFDLPVSEVPEFYPDILELRDSEYGDMPTFATINEAWQYSYCM
jgi:hypothetical protein